MEQTTAANNNFDGAEKTAATTPPGDHADQNAVTRDVLDVREQTARRQDARLFYIQPFPDRIMHLVGCDEDAGLLSVHEAVSAPFNKLPDGDYGWDETQTCMGFKFREVHLVTLRGWE